MIDTTTSYASCIRIERTDGVVLCLTELDKDITINDGAIGLSGGDQVYLSAAGYTPTNLQSTSDNAVNNADIEGILSAVGVQREDLIGGRYDFAKLHIFLYDWQNNLVVKKLGSGHWGEATIKDGNYVAEFRSLSQQLQQVIGRTYNPECDEQLGGPRCTVDLTAYRATGEVVSVIDSQNFTTTLTDDDTWGDDYFNYGKFEFTSGLNDSLSMEVKDFTEATNTFNLFLPMPFKVVVGDTFQVFAGCDKRLTTCKNKFANHINFQGFPFIPGQDQISLFGGQ